MRRMIRCDTRVSRNPGSWFKLGVGDQVCRDLLQAVPHMCSVNGKESDVYNGLAKRPLEVLAIDFTLLEPDTSGIENALVLTDVFTKYTQVIPTRDQKARTVAKVLVKDWFVRFGVPQRIHSDRGRNFECTLVKEICSIYGIAKSHTTPYHPQTHRRRGSIGRYTIDCEPCPTNR